MMTTRSGRKAKPAQSDSAGGVTVVVLEPHAVFFDGEQRTGTLHNVPADTAQQWIRHRWAERAGAHKAP
ncbi:hypothetical protein [Mycolicibacterium sp. 120270]|uniref:hypothetical protein n=1 Tax=Mycolicibacterium sp. 120270 TaxID=3090600 RepID=UPI00299F1DC5|nr:hypothetical protein [Mycolicibacterium sp. 120270]MDX1883047.1 hypothetical protein [Mycolicibacterium sp. 120270]